jgi:hypothetical protein
MSAGTNRVTYTSSRSDIHGTRAARRSSIWKLNAGKWQMAFHQGTPMFPKSEHGSN